MKWKFVNLQTGGDIQIVQSEIERDRFMRYCEAQRIQYGIVRVDEHGVYGEKPDVCDGCEHRRHKAEGAAC